MKIELDDYEVDALLQAIYDAKPRRPKNPEKRAYMDLLEAIHTKIWASILEKLNA